jgi:uncharacterized membrane protein YqjE
VAADILHADDQRCVVTEPARTLNQNGDRSVSELVKDLSELVPQLVRDEIKLAQLELTKKGKNAGMGAGMFAGSGLIALYGIGCLIAAAVVAISLAIPPWLAALIVGIVLLAVAGIVAMAGRSRIRKATPPVPRQAINNVHADIREIKEDLHDKGHAGPQTAGQQTGQATPGQRGAAR